MNLGDLLAVNGAIRTEMPAMLKFIYRLMTQKIYIAPHTHADSEMPQYLSLREMADLPVHHPCTERAAQAKTPRAR